MEWWENEWEEDYNPGKSMWKGRGIEDEQPSHTNDPEVQMISPTGPLQVYTKQNIRTYIY